MARVLRNLFLVASLLSGDVNGQAPTLSPHFGNLPCSICPDAEHVVTNGKATIPTGTLSFLTTETTCSDLAESARLSHLKPYQCALVIKSVVPTFCGCQANDATTAGDNTTIPTTDSGSMNTTTDNPFFNDTTTVPATGDVNVTAPTTDDVNATETTGDANATETTEVISTVVMQLESVATLMDSENIDPFNAAMSSFLQEYMSNETVVSITATLVNQTLVGYNSTNSTKTRFLRFEERQLQANSTNGNATQVNITLYPLKVTMSVSALVPITSSENSTTLSSAVVSVVDDNESALISSLQTVDAVYFASVVEVDTNVTAPAPAPAPKKKNKFGLPRYTTIAIVCSICFGLLVILFCLARTKTTVRPVETNTLGSKSFKTTSPSTKSTYQPQSSFNKSSSSRDSLAKSSSFIKPSAHSVNTLRDGMSSRVVHAPSGKLGIVIDTSVLGPVVNTIKAGSPLEGKVFVGDIIADINGIDTSGMSASEVTAVVIKTAGEDRKLTILSKN